MIEFTSNDKKDFVLMQLLHYFITVENYSPMVVNGAKNEVWLENMNADYRIIRINANYIHNDEQLNTDLNLIKNIIRQVKRKTHYFKVNTLNILINTGSSVSVKNTNNIDCISIDCERGLKKSSNINDLYPELKNNLVDEKNKLDFIMNITNDINEKNKEETRKYNELFGKKSNIVTHGLIIINIIVFFVANFLYTLEEVNLFSLFSNSRAFVVDGEIYRLITSAFLHQNIFHLGFNMYALYIIGQEVESFVGKYKFLIIYLGSALTGSLLSCVMNASGTSSIGASGAIFGLMGMLLYFGMRYRLYLDNVLKTQIIPLIVANLAIGFLITNIDNAAHIGGLVGGVFLSMFLGADGEKNKTDRINGFICFTILVAFLTYLLFFTQ